jgi:carboxyl-terminal processing protease
MKRRFAILGQHPLVIILLLVALFSCKKEEETPNNGYPKVDLSITSNIDKTKTDVDGYVTYTITAKNLGPNTATEVVVADTLPDGLVMDSFEATKGTYDEKTRQWAIGDFEPNTSFVLSIKAKVAAYGSITNTVRIAGKINDPNNDNNVSKTTVVTNLAGLSKEQLWSFDIYSAMQEIYLWNDALPKAFDPRKYATPENAMDYLIGLKINPDTKEAIDRYSFLDKIGNISGEIDGGTASGDYGFMVTAGYNSSNDISFFVTYVYKNSPAGKAGVERSFEVVKINGSEDVHPKIDANKNLVTTSAGYVNMVNSLFRSSSASFTFKKQDGSTLDVSLNTSAYSINSVLYESSFTEGVSKVGYMVFNQFLGETAQAEITNTINRFQSTGVQYLIVDLRYNGGGSVATCEKFCNLVAPQSASNKPMYSYKFNAEQAAYYATKGYATTIKYNKTNAFAPKKIYFIVGGGTASASELLINNLRPYFTGDIYLIGTTTYGKPCGFWATPIGYSENQTTTKEGYDLYAVSFETINANKEGGYYAGMTPGSIKYPGVTAYDTPQEGWGSKSDARLAQALYHITNGSFMATTKSAIKQPICNIDRQLKGMIDFRKRAK